MRASVPARVVLVVGLAAATGRSAARDPASTKPFLPGADTCGTAVAIGPVPPDYSEPGMTLAPDDVDWRSFQLTSRRRVRIETVGDPFASDTRLSVFGGCLLPEAFPLSFVASNTDREPWGNDRTSLIETQCLLPGTYYVEVGADSPDGATGFELRIQDLGPCLLPNDLVIRATRIEDVDGDQDGYPDAGETVDVRLVLSNKTDVDLIGVVARIRPADASLCCVRPDLLSIGPLSAGADLEVPTVVRLTVHPAARRAGTGVTCVAGECSNFHRPVNYVGIPTTCSVDADCRRSVDQTYAGSLEVALSSDLVPEKSLEILTFEMDLDATHPAVSSTTFSEGFESGFGAFTLQNLDADRASNALSDGLRCQYHNPDRPGCGASGCSEPCYLGFASGQDPVNAWHVHGTTAPDGGRSYLGVASAHFGVHTPDSPMLDTYQLSQLDALRTAAPIALAARVCRDDPASDPRACNASPDCDSVGGGPCVAARPELSFKHQISTTDERSTNVPFREAADRAVVHARIAGSPVWEKIHPFENLYDVQGTAYFSNCMFDPTDDGNNEDSFSTWDDYWISSGGPSSTCAPEFVFSYLGDTDGSFDPSNVGRASDGPGLAGDLGPGTWVESRFDLSRFRGRAIDLRFLMTSIKIDDIPTLQDAFHWNPVPDDDGWYVDDVRVTRSLGAVVPTASTNAGEPPLPPDDPDADGVDSTWDNCPGTANPEQIDTDRDGSGNACDLDDDADGVSDAADCAPVDASSWAVPSPARDLRLEGKVLTVLTWSAPSDLGSERVLYDTIRSDSPRFQSGDCIASSTALTTTRDPDPLPAWQSTSFYLVRAKNACGGNVGVDSKGVPRVVGVWCP